MLNRDFHLGWDGKTIAAKYIALDTETHKIKSEQPRDVPRLVLMSAFSKDSINPAGKGWVIPSHQVEHWLEAHRDKIWIFHNSAFDLQVLASHIQSAELRNKLWQKVEDYQIRDSMLFKGLWDIAKAGKPGEQAMQGNLEQAVQELGLNKLAGLDKVEDQKYRVNYASIEGDDLEQVYQEDANWIEYPVKDARACFLLYRELGRQIRQEFGLDEESKWGILTERIQVAASLALDQVHRQGMSVDLVYRDKIRQQLEAEIQPLIEQINGLLVESVSQPFDLRHRDKSGQALKTEKGHPRFRLSDFFSLIDDRLKHNPQLLGYQTPRTATGRIRTAEDAWQEYIAYDPALIKYFQMQNRLQALRFLPTPGPDQPADRIHPKYSILSKTGRASCSKPNIQGVPRQDLVRSQYQASAGHVLITCDYSQLELAALAQICLQQFGVSKLAEVINKGLDPHKWTASQVAKCTLQELEQRDNRAELRQKAKAINFGIPGGMGATTLSRYAEESYGVEMSVDEARAWINTFRQEIYPEIGRYLTGPNIAQTFGRNVGLPSLPSSNHVWLFKNTISSPGQINQLTEQEQETLERFLADCRQLGTKKKVHQYLHPLINKDQADLHLFSEQITTLTGRIQSKARYTQARNSPFQGLAADGAKLALFQLFRQGVSVVAFVHDELIIEVPEGSDYRQARDNLRRVMINSMKEVIPDVEVEVKCNGVMKHWYKEVELKYVNDDQEKGQIIPSD